MQLKGWLPPRRIRSVRAAHLLPVARQQLSPLLLRLWRLPGEQPALACALLAATAVHLLGLAAAQLRQARPLPSPLARDDTPELLVFSRQQSLEPAMPSLAIAALDQLPPPPPPPLEPAPPSASTPRPSAAPAMQRSPGPRPAAQPRAQRPPARSAMVVARGAAGHSSSRPGTSARASLTPRQEASLASAVQALERSEAAEANHAGAQASEAGWPPALKPGPEELAFWRRLWQRASTVAVASGLPAASELRQVQPSEDEAEQLQPSRKLVINLGERRLLVWLEGRTWMLLQGPASPPAQGSTGEGN